MQLKNNGNSPTALSHIMLLLCVFFIIMTLGSTLGSYPMVSLVFAVIYIIFSAVSPETVTALLGDDAATTAMLEAIIGLPQFGQYLVLATLLGTAATVAVLLIYAFAICRAPKGALGLKFDRTVVTGYVIGLAVGMAMFSAIIGICSLFGAVTVTLSSSFSIPMVLLFFLAFLIQGMEEELLFRGFLMTGFAGSMSLVFSVMLSSLLFAVMHIGNAGIGVLAIVNLTLFGVFAALLALYTESIWCSAAVHSVWNFAQGNFFGCSVSGLDVGTGIFTTTPTPGRDLTHGGIFGPEAGFAATLVLVLATVAVAVLLINKKEKQRSQSFKL